MFATVLWFYSFAFEVFGNVFLSAGFVFWWFVDLRNAGVFWCFGLFDLLVWC